MGFLFEWPVFHGGLILSGGGVFYCVVVWLRVGLWFGISIYLVSVLFVSISCGLGWACRLGEDRIYLMSMPVWFGIRIGSVGFVLNPYMVSSVYFFLGLHTELRWGKD